MVILVKSQRAGKRVMRSITRDPTSNAWLKAQGLVSVKDLWFKAQGYAN